MAAQISLRRLQRSRDRDVVASPPASAIHGLMVDLSPDSTIGNAATPEEKPKSIGNGKTRSVAVLLYPHNYTANSTFARLGGVDLSL